MSTMPSSSEVPGAAVPTARCHRDHVGWNVADERTHRVVSGGIHAVLATRARAPPNRRSDDPVIARRHRVPAGLMTALRWV